MGKHENTPETTETTHVTLNVPASVMSKINNYRNCQIEKKGKCTQTDAIIDLIVAGCEVV